MEYTLEIHKKRLRKMINNDKDEDDQCPADMYAVDRGGDRWENYDMACKICRQFINCINEGMACCPCVILGCEEALRRTHLALKGEL